MKLLLTSGGVTNESIMQSLIDLLGRPINECNALACSTASYAMTTGAQMAQRFYSANESNNMTGLGWKSVGVFELTALPSIDKSVWLNQLERADVLLVNGGDPLFLNHWMKESGVAEVLPTLKHLVYVGLSAGSMVLAPRIGEEFVGWKLPNQTDETLGLIDFSIFPHLDYPGFDENTMDGAIAWSKKLGNPSYAIDEATAIQVVDGEVEVISEGNWRGFTGTV